MGDYSLTALHHFFDDQVSQGLITAKLGKHRKTSVSKLARRLSSEEQADLRLIDIEKVIRLFEEEKKGAYKDMATIYTYQKRFRKGLDIFLKAMENGGSLVRPIRPNNDVELRFRISDNEIEFRIKGVLSKHQRVERIHKMLPAYIVEGENPIIDGNPGGEDLHTRPESASL